MKIICAWCYEEIGEMGPPDAREIHNICQRCRDRFFPNTYGCVFFPDIICRRLDCRACHVYLKRFIDIPDNICASCGTDRSIWKEVYKQEHYCYIGVVNGK